MLTKLRNTVVNMKGCIKKERRKERSERGNAVVLKLRFPILIYAKNTGHATNWNIHII